MSLRRTLAVGAAVAGVVAVGAASGAVADRLVGSPQIKDGGVHKVDTSQWIQGQLAKADTVPTMYRQSAPATVADVGGTFGKFTEIVRATELHSFTLQPGRYVVTADGFFMTNSADATRDVRMQLALRVNDGSDWGLDYGTAFTGQLSPLANREATTHSTRVVTLDAPTLVQVFAFGYEDDQGSTASGQIAARSYVTAERIG
jgi:hypothetical protein